MPAYNIPRDTSGEGKILYIFSTKALIYTAIGAAVGALFYFIFKAIGLQIVGVILLAIFAFIGFSIATFKVPKVKFFPITEKIGGERIEEILKRYIKFKSKKITKYTLYTKEDKTNG